MQHTHKTRRAFLKSTSASLVTIGLVGKHTLTAKAADGAMRKLETTGTLPPARANHTAVYDSVNNRMLVFGGRGDGGITSDLWSLNLRDLSWQNLNPGETAPAARFGHNAIFDPTRKRMVIFGGQAGSKFFNDTWAYELASNSWKEISPAEKERPEVRYGSVMIYDSKDQRGVIFAGFTDQGRFDDTQAFHLAQATWKDISPSGGVRPMKRCLHTAVYDSRGHRLVLFGGQNSGALGDTWLYDLSTSNWKEIQLERVPDKRFFAASVYDPGKHQMVLFGGSGSQRFDDTWALDLNAPKWNPLSLDGTKPSARHSHSMILIESERRALIFGGNGPSSLNETWELKLS